MGRRKRRRGRAALDVEVPDHPDVHPNADKVGSVGHGHGAGGHQQEDPRLQLGHVDPRPAVPGEDAKPGQLAQGHEGPRRLPHGPDGPPPQGGHVNVRAGRRRHQEVVPV